MSHTTNVDTQDWPSPASGAYAASDKAESSFAGSSTEHASAVERASAVCEYGVSHPERVAAASVVDTIPPAARAFLDEITANKGSLDQAAVAQSVLCFLRVEFEKCNLSVFPGSRDGANKAGSTVAESSGTTWSDEELKDYGSSLKPWADMVESIREKVFDLVPESRNPDNHEGVHTVLTLASGEVTDQTTPLSAAYQGLSDLVYKRMVNVPDMGTEQAGISLGPEDRIYTMLYYVPALRDRYRWQIERPTSRGVPGA